MLKTCKKLKKPKIFFPSLGGSGVAEKFPEYLFTLFTCKATHSNPVIAVQT